VVQEAVTNRTTYLEGKADKLYSLEIHFAVCYEGWKHKAGAHGGLSKFLRMSLAGSGSAFRADTLTVLEEELERARNSLPTRS